MSETQHGNDARNAAADGELTADSTLTAQMAPDYRPVAPVAPFSRSVWLQIALYVVLVALACIPGSNAVSSVMFSLTGFVVGVMIMLFAFFTPLRDGIPGRVTGVILGLLGMIFASTPMLGEFVFGSMGSPSRPQLGSPGTLAVCAWFAGVGALLVVLVVVAFGRQMARLDRSHLIVQLSHMVMDGACTVLCSGGASCRCSCRASAKARRRARMANCGCGLPVWWPLWCSPSVLDSWIAYGIAIRGRSRARRLLGWASR